MFEHLDLSGQQNMMMECYRILQPGGVLRIATPNFWFLYDLITNPDSYINRKYLEWSYSKFVAYKVEIDVDIKDYPVYVVNNFMHDWGHQFIHSNESLTQLGKATGFSHSATCGLGVSDYPELCNCEGHQNEIPDWANSLETMIIEFYKS